MTASTKSAILLLATLIVGVLIGFLASSVLVNQRLAKITEMRERGGLNRVMLGVIQPVDEAQAEQIRAILEPAVEEFIQMSRETAQRRRAVMDSVKKDLEAVLTPEQQERLDMWTSRGMLPPGFDRPRRGPNRRPFRPPAEQQ